MKVKVKFYPYIGNNFKKYKNAKELRQSEEANSSTEFFDSKSVRDFDTIYQNLQTGEYLLKIGEEAWYFKWQ